MATFVETVTTPGRNIVSSQNGRIVIDEAQAELVFTENDGTRRAVHNVDGSYYNDINGDNMTLVDIRGLNTIDPSSGEYRGRWGIAETDQRPFGGFSKPGEDIRELLGESV